ncbi:hypothetical protein ElyMa_002955900 [Elysia marginata]|uniref:Reverse transcriptase domain-containing protein n=1 Tax=Elysia marginata TaxID=1093978 RepID=A0AAV4I6N5_9GAST|nr:hypothetical protein ElyMa_002955900 [Elysia marginata]
MLDSIAESWKTYGMEMNAKKTKTMHIRKEKNWPWRAELKAEKVEDALKGAGLTTSSNGPTAVHMEKSNGKLRVERNDESWLPPFGLQKAL